MPHVSCHFLNLNVSIHILVLPLRSAASLVATSTCQPSAFRGAPMQGASLRTIRSADRTTHLLHRRCAGRCMPTAAHGKSFSNPKFSYAFHTDFGQFRWRPSAHLTLCPRTRCYRGLTHQHVCGDPGRQPLQRDERSPRGWGSDPGLGSARRQEEADDRAVKRAQCAVRLFECSAAPAR